MDPNASTHPQREAQPTGIAHNGTKTGVTVASNTVAEDTPSIQSDAPASLSNGHPSGVLFESTEEKPTPQDINPLTNGHVVAQQQPPTSAPSSPAQHAPLLTSETIDSSTSPVLTPFANPSPSSHLPTTLALTPEQEVKYTTLLTTARSWTTIPSSAKSHESTPLTTSEKLWLTRECLLRYLRASKWIVPTATTRLLSTLTWRREYGVETHSAEYISEENETGKQVILGYDNQGRPCLYLNPHKQNTKGKEKQIQHLVFMLERCIDLMAPGVETLALLVNFKDTRRGQSASVGQGRETLSILQNHYPERLGRALVQDVPWLIWGFFKAIGPFIDPLTREKLKFDEDLRQLVPPEQLIKAYNGDVDFEYVHEKYWKALNELAEGRRKEARERWEMAGGIIGESESYLRGVGESVSATGGSETGLEKAMAGSKLEN